MADKMMATFMEDYLWRTIYGGQFNDRNFYGGLLIEDNLWKVNYGR